MKDNKPFHVSPYISHNQGVPYTDYEAGITKREWMATKILSALISFSHEENVPKDSNVKSSVVQAVRVADWLIEELNKPVE